MTKVVWVEGGPCDPRGAVLVDVPTGIDRPLRAISGVAVVINVREALAGDSSELLYVGSHPHR
jgi:hypothetical protein